MKRNPQKSRWAGVGPAGKSGYVPEYVPLASLTDAQILELERENFSDEEWDELTLTQQAKIAAKTMSIGELMEAELWDHLVNVDEKRANTMIEDADRYAVLDADVWDNLYDDQKEHFFEHNADVQNRVGPIIKHFVGAYEDATSSEWAEQNYSGDYFEQWLAENADEHVEHAQNNGYEDEVKEYIERWEAEGYSEQQIVAALDEALRDKSNYDYETSDEYTKAYFKDQESYGYLHTEVTREIAQLANDLTDVELQYAIDEINRQTDSVYDTGYGRRSGGLTPSMLKEKGRSIERDFENYIYFDWAPDWSQVESSADSLLENEEPEGVGGEAVERKETPIEDRIVYRWKDGTYAVELLPRELVDEGAPYVCGVHGHQYAKGGYGAHATNCKDDDCGLPLDRSDSSLWHCIGDTHQRFVGVLRRGRGKAWSIRSQNGKRKFAIFADLDKEGAIRRIDQAKGYRNRLPGFSAGKHGGSDEAGKLKSDEVMKVAELIHFVGVDPGTVDDLKPGIRRVFLDAHTNRDSKKVADKLLAISESAETIKHFVDEKYAREQGIRENPRTINANPDACPACGGARGGFCGT